MVTIEPQRYFAEQLVDTFFSVKTMVPSGISPETYDPTPTEMVALAHSQAYFCIGYIGFEELWIDKLKSNYPQVKFFDNSVGISLVASDHNDKQEEHHHHHHHSRIDPHIWNSPKQALVIASNMHDALVKIDPEHETFYTERLLHLSAYLREIDEEVTRILSRSSQKSFIIYHPALTYFARDYGLTQHCIEIDGKEPSPDQIKHLIEEAKENHIQTVFIQQEFDQRNAEIIAEETGCKLVVINPLSYNWGEEAIRIAKALSNE
jgi:zinc transport system substrate-binding protein